MMAATGPVAGGFRLLHLTFRQRSLHLTYYSTTSLNSSEDNANVNENEKKKSKREYKDFRDFMQTPKTPPGRAKTPIGKLDEIETGKHPYAEKEPLQPWPDNTNPNTGEVGGPKGPEPTRYGDWERKGRVSDF